MQADSATDRPTLSTREASAMLGVSMQTVQRWVDLGQLVAWKTLGGHRRIDRASVEAILKDRLQLPAQAPTAAPRGEASARVLVVDDDESDRELLVEVCRLTLPQASVFALTNGFDALLFIGQRTPDVLVTDIMMPNLNGFEMLARVVIAPELCPPLIVATSSYTREELRAFGRLPDQVHFFHKSAVSEGLSELLRPSTESAAVV